MLTTFSFWIKFHHKFAFEWINEKYIFRKLKPQSACVCVCMYFHVAHFPLIVSIRSNYVNNNTFVLRFEMCWCWKMQINGQNSIWKDRLIDFNLGRHRNSMRFRRTLQKHFLFLFPSFPICLSPCQIGCGQDGENKNRSMMDVNRKPFCNELLKIQSNFH